MVSMRQRVLSRNHEETAQQQLVTRTSITSDEEGTSTTVDTSSIDELWHSNGTLPSRTISTVYPDRTYTIVTEWHKDGLLHREGGLPAMIIVDVVLRGNDLVKVTERTWFTDGERDDRPMESIREIF